jgi:hypothetical protein
MKRDEGGERQCGANHEQGGEDARADLIGRAAEYLLGQANRRESNKSRYNSCLSNEGGRCLTEGQKLILSQLKMLTLAAG